VKLPSVRGVVRAVVIAGVLYYALQSGGEYTTTKLISQRRERNRIERDIDSLQKVVDSLRRYRKQLDTDAALQERIAREQFGMVRSDKELVYRFVAPDSTRKDTTR
jgi:cell division protein FtsB